MTRKLYELKEKMLRAYGELAQYAGQILTNPDLSREERAELVAWTDHHLAQFESAFKCKAPVYEHIREERFSPQTGLAHLVFHSEN